MLDNTHLSVVRFINLFYSFHETRTRPVGDERNKEGTILTFEDHDSIQVPDLLRFLTLGGKLP